MGHMYMVTEPLRLKVAGSQIMTGPWQDKELIQNVNQETIDIKKQQQMDSHEHT